MKTIIALTTYAILTMGIGTKSVTKYVKTILDIRATEANIQDYVEGK